MNVALWITVFVATALVGPSIVRWVQVLFMDDAALQRIAMQWRDVLAPIVPRDDRALVAAMICVESSGRPEARSSAGAVGLMQVTPIVLEELEQVEGRVVEPGRLVDPSTNIEVGYWYLCRLRRHYGLSIRDALRAYNAGPTRIRRAGSGDVAAGYADRVLAYSYLLERAAA